MHASRETLPPTTFGDAYEARFAETSDYAAYFERIVAGADFTPYYDTCEVPHLGYVFKGKVRFIYDDGRIEEVGAGEMYYITPGHTFEVLEDAETVEFSPKAEYEAHLRKVESGLEAQAQVTA